MKLVKLFAGVGMAVSMMVTVSFSSLAGLRDSGILSDYNGKYAINATVGGDMAQNYYQAEKVLNTACPAVGMTTMSQVYSGADGSVILNSDSVAMLDSIQNQVDDWLRGNMTWIVPQGTPETQVVEICANWVADRMTYDYSASTNAALSRAYQSALSCFTLGTGLCSTYAYALNSMVSYVPINEETGLVDYSISNAKHIQTRFVYNSRHAWSAIFQNGAWHHYDITSYDTARERKYLDMDSSLMSMDKYNTQNVIF